jgi:hypothetical protein
MKFLIDKEINLEKQDLLNTNSYANTIKEAILNSPDDDSFCIGLFGEWGSGKSSIIKTVKENLEESKDKKIRFVTYDAWKYANDSFRRMFLRKMKEDLKLKANSDFDSFYQNKSVDKKINQKPNWIFVALTVVLLVIGIGVTTLIDSSDSKTLATLIFAFIAILVNVIGRSFADLKVSVSEPMTFAPEQFEECFMEMANLALLKDTIFTKPLKWFENILTGNQNGLCLDKIVIVIDNIDRTQKELAYELLTNTKNFLGKIPNVIFLIPIDDGALKKHIANINSEPKEAEEFLRKFFNLTFRIKTFRPIQMYDFTEKLIKDSGLGYNNITIDIISQEYATNPRRIIQFTNNLTVELNYLEKKFGKNFILENESLICVILILKEEWPSYFKLISINTYLLQNVDVNTKSELDKDSALSNFIKNMKAVINYSNSEILNKILSNSESVGALNETVLDNINDGNVENIISLCNLENEENTDLENYLFDKLGKGINNKLYQTEVRNVFSLIIGINNVKEFSKAFNNRILNLLHLEIEKFIQFIEEPELIIKYSLACKDQGLSYLFDDIARYIKTVFVNKSHDYSDFNQTLLERQLEFSKVEDIEIFKESFSNDYIGMNEKEMESFSLSDEKYKILIADEIVEHLIRILNENNFVEEFYSKELIFVCSKIDISSNNTALFFELLEASFKESKMGVLKSDLIELLDLINEIFYFQVKNIKRLADEEKVKSLYTRIFSNMDKSAYNAVLLTKQINTEAEVTAVVRFILNVSKLSLTPINVDKELSEIIIRDNSYLTIFEEILLEYMEKFNIPINRFKKILLDSENYNKTTFTLLKKIFKDSPLTETEEKNKIKSVFEEFKNLEENNSDIFDFLETLADKERQKNILIDCISELGKDDILKLSPKLQHLIFDSLATEENIFDYEENVGFLKAIAEIGEKKHVQKLVKVIIRKLQKPVSINDGLEILSFVKELNTRDTKLIHNNLEALLDKDDYKEKVKSLLEKFKQS